jgi:hypothetical protein
MRINLDFTQRNSVYFSYPSPLPETGCRLEQAEIWYYAFAVHHVQSQVGDDDGPANLTPSPTPPSPFPTPREDGPRFP